MVLTTLDGSLYPTHCLVATQHHAPPNSPVLIVPVDAGLYAWGFFPDLAWPSEDIPPDTHAHSEPGPGVAPIIPMISQLSEGPIRISLNVVPIVVPHLPSLPLLLLLGLGLEADIEKLPYRLLPTAVVAEFPAPAAMAEIFAKFPEQQFERCYMYIHGMWKNSLALGVKDARIVQIVSTAWNVASDARRIRQRLAAAAAAAPQRH